MFSLWILTLATGFTGILALLSPSSVNFMEDAGKEFGAASRGIDADKESPNAATDAAAAADAAYAADAAAAAIHQRAMTFFNFAARLLGISQLCISLFHYLLLDSVDRKII